MEREDRLTKRDEDLEEMGRFPAEAPVVEYRNPAEIEEAFTPEYYQKHSNKTLDMLVNLANRLDTLGLYNEASIVDKLAQEIVIDESQVQPIEGKQWSPAIKRYYATINQIRKELRLGEGMFDRQMGIRLQKMYPGAWNKGDKTQTAREILQNIQDMKKQMQEQLQRPESFSGQKPIMLSQRREPAPQTVSPQQVFPQTNIPSVELPDKVETQLP